MPLACAPVTDYTLGVCIAIVMLEVECLLSLLRLQQTKHHFIFDWTGPCQQSLWPAVAEAVTLVCATLCQILLLQSTPAIDTLHSSSYLQHRASNISYSITLSTVAECISNVMRKSRYDKQPTTNSLSAVQCCTVHKLVMHRQ